VGAFVDDVVDDDDGGGGGDGGGVVDGAETLLSNTATCFSSLEKL
jgi:hypothetical protein